VAEIDSSAPHLGSATTRDDLLSWGAQPAAIAGASQSSGRVLYKGPDNRPEAGLWTCTPGRWRLTIPRDELCYFVAGRAEYQRDNGERIEILPDTLVLFPAGWRGDCTVHETMRNTYMLTAEDAEGAIGSPSPAAPSLRNPLSQTALVDWGVIPTMIEGESRTSGRLLHKGPQGRSECGIWRCTPGRWNCHVIRDEFCHFLAGKPEIHGVHLPSTVDDRVGEADLAVELERARLHGQRARRRTRLGRLVDDPHLDAP
jgi:uncharacterized cupin superfamily protein